MAMRCFKKFVLFVGYSFEQLIGNTGQDVRIPFLHNEWKSRLARFSNRQILTLFQNEWRLQNRAKYSVTDISSNVSNGCFKQEKEFFPKPTFIPTINPSSNPNVLSTSMCETDKRKFG